MVADDVDILAALGVDAVGVGAGGAVADADVQDVHILGVGRVDGPGIAVADQNTVQHDVFGTAGEEQARTPGNILFLRVVVPVAVLGVGVNRALAGDGHILGIDDVDKARKAVQRVALPDGEIVLVLLVMAGEYAGQDRVVSAVGAAQQCTALFEIQRRIALQKQALGAVGAGRHVDRAARGAGGQRCLQLGRVVGHAVGDKAAAARIEEEALLRGGKVQRIGHAVKGDGQRVAAARLQRIEREHIRIALTDGDTVQRDRVRSRGAVAAGVDQLKHRTARHRTYKRDFHVRTPRCLKIV